MSSEKICFLCGEVCPGLERETEKLTDCEFCHEASFCSEALEIGALSAHRPPGLNRCLPYRVSHRNGIGRILVANRDIRPGELAILDRAAAVLPENQPVCLGCLIPIKPEAFPTSVKCPECSLPFCKPLCIENSSHQEECK